MNKPSTRDATPMDLNWATLNNLACPTCGRVYARRFTGNPADGEIKMTCSGCNTTYWIAVKTPPTP